MRKTLSKFKRVALFMLALTLLVVQFNACTRIKR